MNTHSRTPHDTRTRLARVVDYRGHRRVDWIINAPVQSAHMLTIMTALPRLHALRVEHCFDLESLAFLSASSFPALRSFTLFHCRDLMHRTELRHVHFLPALQSLHVESSFGQPLDPLTLSLYTPPTRLIPSLTSFRYARWHELN